MRTDFLFAGRLLNTHTDNLLSITRTTRFGHVNFTGRLRRSRRGRNL
jgi:hypothetical protein